MKHLFLWPLKFIAFCTALTFSWNQIVWAAGILPQDYVASSGQPVAETAAFFPSTSGVTTVRMSTTTDFLSSSAFPLSAPGDAVKVSEPTVGITSLIRGSIKINSGAAYAVSAIVTLNLSAESSVSLLNKMSFSTNGSVWSVPESYKTSKTFRIPAGDGIKVIYVKYFDKAGNASEIYSSSVILDTLPPRGTVKINGGTSFINQTTVRLDLAAVDAGLGVSEMSFSVNGSTWTAPESYATSKSWTFSAGEGAKKVYVKFKDKTGKWSSAVSATATLDSVKPTGSININSGAVSASSQAVTLNLSGADNRSGISTMSFSTDNANWTAPVAFTSSKVFALPSGDGIKTVYVKYFDRAGNASVVYSKAIVLDMLPPTGTIKVNGGTSFIDQPTVRLDLTASDAGLGVRSMRFSSDGSTWTTAEPYAITKTWTFSSGDGNKKVFVKFSDGSENWSGSMSAEVFLDMTKPAGTIDINFGALYTNSAVVALDLVATDGGSGVSDMSFSTDNITWSAPEPFAVFKSFELSSGDGEKSVSVKYFDRAGNASTAYSKEIVLDTTPPVLAFDVAPPELTNVRTLTVGYTADGVLKSKRFEDLAEGVNNLTVSERDPAGNESVMPFSVTVDTVPPAIAVDASTPHRIDANSITVYYTSDGVGKSRTFTDLPEGEQTLTIMETDAAGNQATVGWALAVETRFREKTLQDGTKLFFEYQTVTREVTPEGNELFYRSDGSLSSFRFSDGREISYAAYPPYLIGIYDKDRNLIKTVGGERVEAPDETDLLEVAMQDGMGAYYEKGELKEIKTPEGIRVFNMVFDSDQKIREAILVYPDGMQEVIWDGNRLRRISPDGRILDVLPTGSVVREIVQDIPQYYVFEKTSQRTITQTRIISEQGFCIYDELGILREVRNQNGDHFVYSREEDGDFFMTRLDQDVSSSPNGKSFTGGRYSKDGGIVLLSLADGVRIFFENGKIKSAADADGNTVDYTLLLTDGNFSGLQVERAGAQFFYGAEGILNRVLMPDGSSIRVDNPQKGLSSFQLPDGRVIVDYQLDAQGNLWDGTLLETSGQKQIYQNGILAKVIDPDGTLKEFSDGRLCRLVTAQGAEYLFEDVLTASGESVSRGVLRSVKLGSGIQAFFLDSKVESIEWTSGEELRGIEFDASGAFVRGQWQEAGGDVFEFEGEALSKIIGTDGRQYVYERGLLKEVRQEGRSSLSVQYSYDYDGNPTGWSVEDHGIKRSYDFSGNLQQIATSSASALYGNAGFGQLNMAGGTLLQPQVSTSGVLEGGTVLTSDSVRISFSGDQILAVETPEGLRLEYQNGVLSAITPPTGIRIEIVPLSRGSGGSEDAVIRYATPEGTIEEPVMEYLLSTDAIQTIEVLMGSSWNDRLKLAEKLDAARKNFFSPGKIAEVAANRVEVAKALTTMAVPQALRDQIASLLGGNYGNSVSVSYRFGTDENQDKWMYCEYSGGSSSYGPPTTIHMTLAAPYESQLPSNFATLLDKEIGWEKSIPPIWRGTSVPSPEKGGPSYREKDWKEQFDRAKQVYASIGSVSLESPVPLSRIREVKLPVERSVLAKLQQVPLEIKRPSTDQAIETNVLGEVRQFIRDEIATFQDSAGNLFAFSYDPVSGGVNNIQMNSTDGKTISAEVRYGRVRSLEDLEGELNYSYEMAQDGSEITVMTDPVTGEIRRFKKGRLESLEDVQGLVTEYEYEGDRLVRSRLRHKNQILEELCYENTGDGLKTTDADGVMRWYDDKGDMIRHRTPDGMEFIHRWVTDGDGKQVRITEIFRRLLDDGTVYKYRDQKVVEVVDPGGHVVAKDLSYDPEGRLIGGSMITLAGLEIPFQEGGELSGGSSSTKVNLPGLGPVKIEYDGQGRPAFFVISDGQKTFRYDAAGHLINFEDPDNQREYLYRYSFDPLGQIQNMIVTEKTGKLIGGKAAPKDLSLSSDPFNTQFFLDGQCVYTGKGPYDEEDPAVHVIVLNEISGEIEQQEKFSYIDNSSSRIIAFLNAIPQGKWVAISGYLPYRSGLKIPEEFVNLLKRDFGGQDPVGPYFSSMISWKGAPAKSALTYPGDIYSSAGLYLATTRTRTIVTDASGNQVANSAFITDPMLTRINNAGGILVRPNDVTQTYVLNDSPVIRGSDSEYPLAIQWFKNFNPRYPDSGFYRFWPGYESEDLKSFSDQTMGNYFSPFVEISERFKERAVYFDEDYPTRKLSLEDARRIKEYFSARDFQVVDASGLRDWIENRSEGSLLLMAQDVLPDLAIAETDDLKPLVRDYLDRGGAMIWLYEDPFAYEGYSGNQVSEYNGFEEILGVGFSRGYSSGGYLQSGKLPVYYPDGSPLTDTGIDGSHDFYNNVTGAWETRTGSRTRLQADEMAWGFKHWPEEDAGLEPGRLLQKPLQLNVQVSEMIDWAMLIRSLRQNEPEEETVLRAVFDQQGQLLSETLQGGNTRLYESGQVRHVWSKDGDHLLQYDYDADGNPVRISMRAARDRIDDQQKQARLNISDRKAEALRQMAFEEGKIRDRIVTTFSNSVRSLEAQRRELESRRMISFCYSAASGDNCVSYENPVTRMAIASVTQQLILLNQAEADSMSELGQAMKNAKQAIEADEQKALESLDLEILNMRGQITEVEANPLAYHYYRLILGRDPGTEEIRTFVRETLAGGGVPDIQKLRQQLRNSQEYASRKQGVEETLQKLIGFFTEYFLADDSRRISMVLEAGLTQSEAVPISASDWREIRTWLESRDLHFGHSAFFALTEMLKAEGKDSSISEVASKVLMIDILSGTIHRFTEGELELSLFALERAARFYGVRFFSAELTWGSLVSLYEKQRRDDPSKPFRLIAHINGNHYVTVTSIQNDQVTYKEANKGAEGELVTVSGKEFLDTWVGYALSPVKPGNDREILPDARAQNVRGSFLPWLLPLILLLIKGFVLGVMVAVKAILFVVTHAVLLIKEAIVLAAKGLMMLTKGILNVGKFMFQAVRFGVKGLIKSIDFVRQGILKGFELAREGLLKGYGLLKDGLQFAKDFLFSPQGKEIAAGGKVIKTFSLSQNVARNMVAYGVGFTGGKALETLGTSPSFSRIAAAFLTGGILGINTLLTQGLLTGFCQGSFSAMVMQGVNELGMHLNLPPPLTQALAIVSASVTGAALNPSVTIPEALRKIFPSIAGELAQYGFSAVGRVAGIDPRLTGLLGIPVSAAVGGISKDLLNSANGMATLWHSIQDVILSKEMVGGIVSLGAVFVVDKLGLGRSFFTAFSSRIVAGIMEDLLTHYARMSLVDSIITSVDNSIYRALDPKNLQSLFAAVSEKGLAGGFDQYATSILTWDTIEEFTSAGMTFAEIITAGMPFARDIFVQGGPAKVLQTVKNGKTLEFIFRTLGDGRLQILGIHEMDSGVERLTKWSIDDHGEITSVTVEEMMPDGTKRKDTLSLNGDLQKIEFKDWDENTFATLTYNPQGAIEFNNYNLGIAGHLSAEGLFQFNLTAAPDLQDFDELIYNFDVSNLDAQKQGQFFTLFTGNGFWNQHGSKDDAPQLSIDFIHNITDDQARNGTPAFVLLDEHGNIAHDPNGNVLTTASLPVTLYSETGLIGNVLRWSAETWFGCNFMRDKIESDLRDYFDLIDLNVQKYGLDPGNQKIYFAHSGNFQPLIKALEHMPDEYRSRLKTVITYEAPYVGDGVIHDPYLETLVRVRGGTDSFSVPFIDPREFQLADQNGNIKPVPGQYNIEITGASHSDFAYHPEYTDPVQREISRKTNLFMRDLQQKASDPNPNVLKYFLSSATLGVSVDPETGAIKVDPGTYESPYGDRQ